MHEFCSVGSNQIHFVCTYTQIYYYNEDYLLMLLKWFVSDLCIVLNSNNYDYIIITSYLLVYIDNIIIALPGHIVALRLFNNELLEDEAHDHWLE